MAVPEFLWHCSRDSEVIGSDILDVFMSLSLYRRNAPNYRQNDRLLETCFSVNNLIVGNSLRYFNANLRLIWRFSEPVSEYESVFRMFVWIIILIWIVWIIIHINYHYPYLFVSIFCNLFFRKTIISCGSDQTFLLGFDATLLETLTD